MSELLHLQQHFQDFLLSGSKKRSRQFSDNIGKELRTNIPLRGSSSKIREEEKAEEVMEAIQDFIVSTAKVSVDTRLGIYQDAYKIRLMESLSTNYPALYAYLGTEEFNKLASYYVDAHPSTFRSIRWYGGLLPEFIKLNYPDYSYLMELAFLEWKMNSVFDAADQLPVQIEDMASVPPEAWPNLQFVLHPSVQRIDFFFNTIAVWQALIHDQELPQWQENETPTNWVLWRSPSLQIQFYSMSQEEAWALDGLAKRQTFAALCEGLCEWVKPEDVGMRAASYLKTWIQNGMLSQLLIAD